MTMRLLVGSQVGRNVSEKNGTRTVTIAPLEGGASYAVITTESQFDNLEGVDLIRMVITGAELPSCICLANDPESLAKFAEAMDLPIDETRALIRTLPSAPVKDEALTMANIAIAAGCTSIQEVQQYLIERKLSPMSDIDKLQAVSKRLAEHREILANLGEVGTEVLASRKANAAAKLQRRGPVKAD